eukprot:CAMPEP_0195105102 /NCGR_PEP_ID=MMETSP0448-20130528/74961_1 /TAXON_ID=66468 /ORGANISM="Heterocapsa triquestra, Strain CCMP 448" /LENGTH=57 /DNA_ID=CAMNT_0040141061 /DNA_START=78 /DNA_END=248 /DNA_ORIENTATION=-
MALLQALRAARILPQAAALRSAPTAAACRLIATPALQTAGDRVQSSKPVLANSVGLG